MKARITAWVIASMLGACQGVERDQVDTDEASISGVKVTGELQSANSRYFGPPAIPDMWNYTISFMAPDGAEVGPGTPLLRFDSQELMTKLRDKRNSLNEKQKELEKQLILGREQLAELSLMVEEARAALDKAELKADIPSDLLAQRDYRENQLIHELAGITLGLRAEELEREEQIQNTEAEILNREIGVLQAEVNQLQGSISSMTIKAPAEGVVIHATDRRNNKHTVGDNVWMGRRVIEFPDLSELQLYLEIPERESARIRVGQSVHFTLDAIPDRSFSGNITELASVVHTRSRNQPAKVFDAIVSLDQPEKGLMRPGMSVNATIVTVAVAGSGP